MKKLICATLAATLLLLFSTNAFALSPEQDYSALTNEELVLLLNSTEEEIIEAREIYGDNFDNVVSEYLNSDVALASFGPMGTYEWTNLSATFNTGVIIVSKDQSTILRHGHAALCYTSTDIIEHPGSGELSHRVTAESAFRNLGAVATFLPTGVTTQQKAQAAYYANNNLIGWEYSVIAPRNSTELMNCATLVWKAYNYAGVTICGSAANNTVYPSMIELDGYTTRLYATSQYLGATWIFSVGDEVVQY